MMLLFSIISIITIILLYKRHIKKFQDIDKLPGPSFIQLLKDLYKASSEEGIVSYLTNLNEKYGPVVRVWFHPFAPKIFTTDMEYVNNIYRESDHFFSPALSQLTFLDEGIGSNSNAEIYKFDKQIITKTFNNEYISEILKIYDKQYDRIVNKIRKEKKVDVQKLLHEAFLKVMIDSFHHKLVELKEEDIQRYGEARQRYYVHLFQKMNSFFISIFHKFTTNYKLSRECHEIIVNFTTRWLQKFKTIENGLRTNKNLVFAMLNAGVPDSRIIANINTLIQAGQDTMAIPLTMALRELSRRPNIQNKVREEINSVLGENYSEITLNDLNRMTYLHAVIKESVRRYFPLPFLDRELRYDIKIRDTYLPKGTVVMFNLAEILKSPKHYKNPLTFDPERFYKENALENDKSFVGYGFNIKTCPGKKISYCAMKLLTIKLLKEFNIKHFDDEHEPKFVVEFFYRSANGIPVEFEKL